MTTTTELDPILDAIDWDAPTPLRFEQESSETAADKHPALYEFIATAAELIQDDNDWQRFTAAFNHFERLRGRR